MTREEMYLDMIKEMDKLIEICIQSRDKMVQQLEELREGPISELHREVSRY